MKRSIHGWIPAATAIIAGLVTPWTADAQEGPDLHARFSAHLETLRSELIEVRRDLHRHPEVSGEEERTAGVVAKRLRELGLEVRTGVGGHGVVARLDGEGEGPVVAFRADMDAVPSNAPDPVDFPSENPGVRHICGHDIHTTVGLALAEGLAAVRDELPGSVVFVFQPAEERATGARAMIADGALDGTHADAIFALHTAPLEVGSLATLPGVMMAWRDRVRVDVSGDGDLEAAAKAAHAAVREIGTVNPMAAVTVATDPDFILVQLAPASRSDGVGWSFSGSVTVASSNASANAKDRIDKALRALASDDVTLDFEYDERAIAGVTNDPALTVSATASAERVLGEGTVVSTGGIVPAFSEDFGSFQAQVPGVMFFLGVSNTEKGWVGMPHSPGYIADEESIFVGARAMAAVLLDRLDAAD